MYTTREWATTMYIYIYVTGYRSLSMMFLTNR